MLKPSRSGPFGHQLADMELSPLDVRDVPIAARNQAFAKGSVYRLIADVEYTAQRFR
jgi:hypothetical protein